jgi:aspartyl-tRNA(Asn)/glutamyl-tRNA(Gln) amidotransferase subunit B
MRTKETAGDYRYFPDPNVMPIVIDDKWYADIQSALPEFPEVKKARYTAELGLGDYDADLLTGSRALCDAFEAATAVCGSAKEAANWLISDCMNLLNKRQMTPDQLCINGTALGQLIKLVIDGKVGRGNAKKILEVMLNEDIDPAKYAEENGFIVSNDTGLIDKVIKEAIAADPRAVADFKGGKEKALMALFGKCMKQLKGNCDPQVLRTMLIDEINKA